MAMPPQLCTVILLVFSGTVIKMATPNVVCPLGCTCDTVNNSVSCSGIEDTTWSAFFNVIPNMTKSLFVEGAHFPTLSLSKFIPHQTLRSLHKLKIVNSNVSFIGERAFSFFPNLVELHLHHCAIGYMDIDALALLPHLELLNMSSNLISTLHKDTFSGTNRLRILDLANNKLEKLPHTIFLPTPGLQVVNVTKNRLSYIHPQTFNNLTNLHTIVLQHNRLESLHSDTLNNLTNLQNVHLGHNPWDCNCGLHWLYNSTNDSHPFIRDEENIRCLTPPEYTSLAIQDIPYHGLQCTVPQLLNSFTNVSIFRLTNTIIKCNATGYPPPSIYWLTPRGVLALQEHRKWMTPDITKFEESHLVVTMPIFSNSKLIVLEDGSLSINQIRSYFRGNYTCVAENPAGVDMATFYVGITPVFHENKLFSMFIGACCAFSFLILSVIYALIRQCCFYILKKRHMKKIENMVTGSNHSLQSDSPSGFLTPKHMASFYSSPYESPIKCTTPEEDFASQEAENQMRINIRETLEDARFRLRSGMEKSVGRIRSSAQYVSQSSRQYMHTIRESSSHYMHNLRESGSNTIHTLRSSGSQYANRMRAGVVLGVEQVKYHVQSMRELCLSGNIGQTISTISVATDVDSQERTDVVKKITYV